MSVLDDALGASLNFCGKEYHKRGHFVAFFPATPQFLSCRGLESQAGGFPKHIFLFKGRGNKHI